MTCVFEWFVEESNIICKKQEFYQLASKNNDFY